MTREEVAAVIATLGVGDIVEVWWDDGGNSSIERGPVWDPPDSNYFGLGAGVLDPADTQLLYIAVTKRAPVSEPPLGSVVVWEIQNGTQLQPSKRYDTGWRLIGGRVSWTWDKLTQVYGPPAATYTLD